MPVLLLVLLEFVEFSWRKMPKFASHLARCAMPVASNWQIAVW